MLKRLLGHVIIIATFSFSALLAGCAATDATLGSSQLNVETKMSSSIFLEPVAPSQRTILVQVRNTSGQPSLNLDPAIRAALIEKGYTVVEDPAKAHFILQANVLQVGEVPTEGIDAALASGYGGAAIGAGIGAVAGTLVSGHRDAVLGTALAGAAIGYLANTLVKDNRFSMITDIQISERVAGSVDASTQHQLKQGTSGSTSTKYHETNSWERYQTRVVSTAHKANLNVQEATVGVSGALAQSLAGLF